MADFNSKISTIRQDLDALLGTIRSVETELHGASASFAELAANAKDISSLSSAIQKLGRFLDSNKSPFLDEIKGRVKDINTELNKLNVRQLETATTALEANAKAMAAISRAQANTNRNLESAKATIAGVRSELSLLESQSGTSGSALEGAVGRIQKSLEAINGLQNIGGVIGGLNQLDPTKYNQAADSLDRVLKTVEALKRANISIDVSAATEGQKLSKRPITPVVQAPTVELPAATTAANQRPPRASARTVQYAQENNIDLSQVVGTGARGNVTKEDALRFKRSTQSPVDVSVNISALLQQAEKKQASLARLDSALDQIAAAKQRAFDAATKEHGLRTSNQIDIARKYLIPEQGISAGEAYARKQDFSEIRKNKESDDLETTFARQLRKQGEVETGLPAQFEKIKVTDDKAISDLIAVREDIDNELQRLTKQLDKLPELAIGDVAQRSAQTLRRAIDQTQVATHGEISPGVSADYALSALAGHKKESYIPGGALPAARESDLYHDAETQEYLTKGNKIVGANAQEVANNLETIKRAVDASPHGIAIVGTTGGDVARASIGSTFSGDKGVDHVLAVKKDDQGNYVPIEHFGELDQVSQGNRTGQAAFGTPISRRRTLEEVAASDRVSAVPLVTSPEKANRFIQELESITKPGETYSFIKDEQTAQRLGGVVGETCASALARAGQRAGVDLGSNTKLAGPLNVTTPTEVIEGAKNLARTNGQLGYQPSGFEQFNSNLSQTFTKIIDRLKASFTELTASLKNVSFGDIFEYIKDIFKSPTTGSAAQSSIPEFAIGAGGIRQGIAEFSKNVYRPVQTGATFFGAGLNAAQEVAKGVQTGGPGGFLDVAGGLIKGAHTVANANAYYGLGVLPKGVGEVFNQRRSETLLDIIETIVGAKTGYQRGSIDKNFTRLKEQEAPLEERKADLKEAIKSGSLVGDDLTKAHNELAAITEELKQLRSSINAYNRVIAEEAKNLGGPSVGKKLSEEALKGTVQASVGGSGLLNQQAQESLSRFSAGTGFSQATNGNLSVLNPQQFEKTLRNAYGDRALGQYNVSKIAGANIPNGGLYVNSQYGSASTAVHEGVHKLVGDVNPNVLYNQEYLSTVSANARGTGLSLPKPEKFTQAIADGGNALLNSLQDGKAKSLLSQYYTKPETREYYNRPTEQYAYTGQALLTGNDDLKRVLEHIYGRDLYESLVNDLKTSIPDTFGDEALPILRQRFAQFETEFNKILKSEAAPELSLGNGAVGIDSIGTHLAQFGRDLPEYGNLLARGLDPNSSNAARIAQTATNLYLPQNTPQRTLFESFNSRGGDELTQAAIKAVTEPTKANINKLFGSAKAIDVQNILEEYIKRIFTEGGLDLKGGLIAKNLFSADKQNIPGLIDTFATQFAPKDITFRDELNTRVRDTTGRNIQAGSYSQQAVFDPSTGLQKYSVSAKTADGAVVSLNAHVDEFGRKKIEEPEKAMGRFAASLKEVATGALRQLGDQFTYTIVAGIQEMFQKLLSVQDELAEVANLFNKVGDAATKVKSDFLFQSVNTAVKTGQGFDEALQSNIKNFKTLGNVKDPTIREDLSNQISRVQLGAQTAFGLPLDQSLEAIPAILASIKNGMDGITDPAEKTTAAVTELRNVMNEVVTATRATGADGTELITVYSRLAESAKEYGLNSKQLLGIAATSSVAIGRGPEETTNILKSLLEGSYLESNQTKFASSHIATKEFNPDTNTIENRGFDKILKDLYQLSQDPTKNVEYSQLVQGIVGKKIAPDAQKIISAVGRNYDQTQVALGQTQSGTFDNLVSQKSQTVTGSLNKLNATGTQLLGSLLVGTGGFDSAAKLFDNLSSSAVKLTGFLNANEGSIKSVIKAIAPFLTFLTVGFATKNVNLFEPIAKGINDFQKTVEATKAKLIDFGAVGEGASTGLTRSLELTLAVLKEMQQAAVSTGQALNTLNPQVAGKNPLQAGTINAAPELAIGQSEVAPTIQQGITTLESVVARPQTRLDKIKGALEKPGAAAGALAAPVAFDLIAGGTSKDNLINVGAGIAGGIAGAFAGGPYGAIVGYSIAKTISEKIDISGSLGTSDKEAGTFAEKLAQVVFNKKSTTEDTPTQAELTTAKGQLTGVSTTLGVDQLKANVAGANTGFLTNIATQISSDTVKHYLDLQSGKVQPGLLDNLRNNKPTEQLVNAFGGNKQLLDIFAGAGVSSVQEFFTLLDEAAKGTGPLSEAFTKLSVDTQRQALASQDVVEADTKRAQLQSAQDLIDAGQKRQTELESKLQSDYQTPYGLDKYNSFGSFAQGLNKSFAPELAGINKGTITGQDASAVLDRLTRSQESLSSLPQTLQQLVPLAQSLGLNTGGLEQRLYNVGAQGQGQLVQRFQPAIEADRNVQLYELQQSRLRGLQGSDSFKSNDAATLAEVAALQKALATDKARYDINKAFLELLKGQSGALLDQTAQVEAQNKTRQLISAGTPAQFQPASIFDTKGTTSTQLNNAIDFALAKQRKLEALNPEYRKEFAKDQFLLQSGGDFKGVTGVNQGFVQEFLQQQQQKEAPLQDLSQYSDQQISKILDQARSLQGQAEKLDPSRAGKYDNDRILILKKNNDLLAQTGIGQEFLKAAIDANTKSNDTLRGHYNLPSDYKSPTIFDYYASGGKEKGDKNFPNGGGTGLVPLAFAQQLADQIVKGNVGDKGANLLDVKGTSQPGARPLFYPTPGTAAVYSEVEPTLIPDSIKADQNITAAVQRFLDFKQKQIDDLDGASQTKTIKPTIEDRLERDRKPLTGGGYVPSLSSTGALLSNQAQSPKLPPAGYLTNTDFSGPGGGGGKRDVVFTDASEKTKTTLSQLSQSTGKAKDDLVSFGTGANKAGTAISTIASALPSAGIGAASLVTSAAAFNGAVTSLIAKVASFDLAQAIKNANIQIIFNGAVVPTSSVTITSTAAGTNTLSVGTAAKTGSKLGDNRQ